jgi:hypothetical protein
MPGTKLHVVKYARGKTKVWPKNKPIRVAGKGGGKGKGWHGDSAGHAAARKKAGGGTKKSWRLAAGRKNASKGQMGVYRGK